MDNGQGILREWLATKLEEHGRGAKSALAVHLKLRNGAISRMIKPDPRSGFRVIKATELAAMINFFDETPPGFDLPLLEEREELFSLYDSLSLKQQAAILAMLRAFAGTEKQE